MTAQSQNAVRPTAFSPRLIARLAGVFYLLTIVAGIFAQIGVSGKLVIDGDAGATATNIVANTDLLWLGFASYLIEMACQITMVVLIYRLLNPVSRSVALISMALNLIGCTIKILSRLFFIAPLLVLGGESFLRVFSVDQLNALALLFLNLNDQAAGMAVVFFGLGTLLNGILVFRSTFFPRLLGVLSIFGGLGWLTFLYPPLGLQLYMPIVMIALVGSLVSIGWYLVVGVDEQKWLAKAQAASPVG